MEIVDSKTIKKFVWIITTVAIVFTVIPIALYFIKFHGKLSDSQANWGVFGDYIGGIVGTIFSLIAVVFSVISIYITLRIATRIQENEHDFNMENHKKEMEKFQKEIELVQKQNKPFPFLHVIRYKDKVEVEIFNQGTGPLIVKNWKIQKNEKDYNDFGTFIKATINYSDYEFNTITFRFNNVSKFVLAPGASKRLLHVVPVGERSDLFNDFIKECKGSLQTSKFEVEYEDIFENLNVYKYNF